MYVALISWAHGAYVKKGKKRVNHSSADCVKRVNVHLIKHTALYFKTIIVTLIYLFIIKKKSYK